MSEAKEIVITGVGMKTAVGEHAIQSCASVRAGVNRFAEWPHFGASFDEDGTALIVSAVQPDLGKGSWVGKARTLLTAPLYEAVVDAGLFDFEHVQRQMGGYRAGVYLGVPRPDRPGTPTGGLERFADEVGTEIFAAFSPHRIDLFALDQVGGALALAEAVGDLEEARVDVAIVGGVDSLLHPVFLRSLHDAGRLKTPATPVGLIPGEAAAFLVLERADDARRRGLRPRIRIGPRALEGQEPSKRDPKRLEHSDTMARVVQRVLAASGGASALDRVIVDLNGERWRFREWGLVDTRCLAELPNDSELWHPMDCVGDVGAAFLPLAVGMATRALERGYAGEGEMLICAASDQGDRAAILVRPHRPSRS
jgi:3-oxoacyl-[acyl-carrier-protein] synthase-1